MPETLEDFILQEIKKSRGFMDVATFMTHALCHPKYGYYMTRDPFGRRGDFTTAPEISQMFGEVIGAWVVDVWIKMGRPAVFTLLECGPGRGTLMADMLRVAAKVDGFTEAARIVLLEASPVLKAKQRESLAGQEVMWVESIAQISRDMPVIVIGNEFLDALPVHQVLMTAEGWRERGLVWDEAQGRFVFGSGAVQASVQSYLTERAVAGVIYEISPERLGFIRVCAEIIRGAGGAALFIDYGHEKSSHGETLQAVRGHKFVDVLRDVGQADITAHVDFEPLLNAVNAAGLSCLPIVRQRDFLQRLGMELRAAKLQEKDKNAAASFRRLVEVDQMGHLFKVMCFYQRLMQAPEGF